MNRQMAAKTMSLLFSDDLRVPGNVAEVVKSFDSLKPSGYLGRTALQKLVYFCKAVGVPIPCSFEMCKLRPLFGGGLEVCDGAPGR